LDASLRVPLLRLWNGEFPTPVDVVPDRSLHGDIRVQLKLWDEFLTFDKKGSIFNQVPQANGI
jgi:hypothetical protein